MTDLLYLLTFAALWGATWGLALGCQRLQHHRRGPGGREGTP